MRRLRAALHCCVTAFAVVFATNASAADGFQETVAPLLEKYCYQCHGPEQQEAGIRYDQIDGFRSEDRYLWTNIHEKLSAREMPPDDQPRPTAGEQKRILDWIEQQSAIVTKRFGAGNLRRLNRRELSAALQDLTGLRVNYADALPGDGTVNGFDTGAEGLQDAADSVAQTLRVTRRAVDGIYFLDPPSRTSVSLDLRETKDVRRALDAWKDDGVVGKLRGEVRPEMGLLTEPKWVGERGSQDITVPPPADGSGILRLKLAVAVIKPDDSIPDPQLWVEIGAKDIDYREITAKPQQPQELVYEVQVDDLAIEKEGIRISLSNKVEVPYAVKGFENEDKSKPDEQIPGGPGLFRPAFDRKQTPLDEQPVPFIVLQAIECDLEYVAAWPPAAWQADVGEVGDNLESARRLLALWMERAWRRPVGEAEQQRFVDLYQRLREQNMEFDEALRATFQSVLLSSAFRYLASPADADPVIAQHAIASRLSFMLVGAPPDEELRRLAAAGKLREPAVLDEQVERLLDDPRSDAFVHPFVSQWLVLDQPITVVMDYFQKQDFRFARHLKASMREETISYVAQLLADNRPAQELIDSDWTMMNHSLAIHYGYKGIEGAHLRKVQLRPDDPHGGGILGHAGIQSMLCWMGDNWVIYRGAWALRHILDDPPPPPPLEVPELVPSDGENHGKTFKELLVQHQNNAKCSVCHKSIDPMGFAFQNFDISGRWRDVEYERYVRNELDGKIEWRGAGKPRPVDAAGQLPRGEKYNSFAECKELIVKHYMQNLVGGLLKNLMIYATGRKPVVEDVIEIKQIIRQQAARGYPMRDLIKSVVRSEAFLSH